MTGNENEMKSVQKESENQRRMFLCTFELQKQEQAAAVDPDPKQQILLFS